MSAPRRVNVLGVPVAAHTTKSILAHIEQLVDAPGCAAALAANAHALNLTYKHPEYLDALRRAELVYVDGASLLLASRVLGRPLPERLTTTDLWPHLCSIAIERGWRFFLLGGEEGFMEEAAEAARKRYSGLQIAGTHHGFFDMEDLSVVERINEARPHILWVGMGDPRQALWTMRHKERLAAGIAITCGGMFKIVTGKIKRAGERWRRGGFEWFYRMLQEPLYTWRRYLIGLPAFGFRVLAQKFFGHRAKLEGN